jgi:cytochrome c biogenesis protein CcmG/thiol:disulfide interchange protein DsbE
VPRGRLLTLIALSVAIPAVVLGVILVTHDGSSTSAGTTPVTAVSPYDRSKAAVGKPAPDFALPDLAGKTVRLSQYRGTPVVLTFFASWCHPCEEELPALEQLQREYDGKVAVLAVNYQDLERDTRQFVADHGVTYPALIEDNSSNPVAARYGVHGPPITFFIDRNGVVAAEPLYGEGSRKALQPGVDAILR